MPEAPRFRPDPGARERAWAVGEAAAHLQVAALVTAALVAGFAWWAHAQPGSRYAWGASWAMGFGVPRLAVPLAALATAAALACGLAAARLRRSLLARRPKARRRLARLALAALAASVFSLVGGLGTLAAWARDRDLVPADMAVPLAVVAILGGLPAPWAWLLWRRAAPVLRPEGEAGARDGGGRPWTCPACTRSYATVAGAPKDARCPQCA